MGSNRALNFIKLISPHLKEKRKKKRAEMLLDEYKKLTPRTGKYTEEMEQAKFDFEERFLNT